MKKDKKYIHRLQPIAKNKNLISVTNIYSVFEEKHFSPYYFDGECHSFWEMVYVVDGMIGVTADNRVLTLSKGDIIIHKPMEFHKIWTSKTNHSHTFICSFDIEGNACHKLMNGVYHARKHQCEIMESMLNFLGSKSTENLNSHHINHATTMAADDETTQLFTAQLQHLLLSLSYLDKDKSFISAHKGMNLYTEIANILEENVYGKISIKEIAQICNVSPTTAKNSFAMYSGISIHKYFLNIKIRTAMELLGSGKTVNEVSDMLDFSNPNYFSYVFKRETGQCASTYKK